MADEDEVDIEGDFELAIEPEPSVAYDVNELPSKTANLLPEFTQPPWMLEQGWSLDHLTMDEKSKATIEKMLLEEQHYLNGTKSVGKTKPSCSTQTSSTYKKPWTQEEKDLFHKGLEIFGRSWTKIAQLIPTRTTLQVKNYAQQFFKTQNKHNARLLQSFDLKDLEEISRGSDKPPDPLETALKLVTTGQPTVPSALASPQRKQLKPSMPLRHKSKKKPRLEEDTCHSDPVSAVQSCTETSILPTNVTLNHSCPNLDTGIHENLDMKLDIRDMDNILQSPQKKELPDDVICIEKVEEDEDVEIDIEDDSEVETDNAVLLQRSSSPSSVYDKLIQSVHLETQPEVDEEENVEKDVPNDTGTYLGSHDITEHRNEVSRQSGVLGKSKDTEESLLNGSISSSSSVINTSDQYNSHGVLPCEMDGNSTSSSELQGGEQEDDTFNPCEFEILTSTGKTATFPIPVEETSLERDQILDEEKYIHSEFFDGRPMKTPQRYLTIRNHIIDAWEKCKPKFLYKTAVRPGLKNCGDVNCIGRIHTYLEVKGCINFNCEEVCYKRPTKRLTLPSKVKIDKETLQALQAEKMEAMRPRKRRVRDAFGNWINEDELEGTTIEHKPTEEGSSKPKVYKIKYDPFKLVPCMNFSEEKKAPFLVDLSTSAQTMMDVHSHMAKTEVIGLLGGTFSEEQGKLQVFIAEPCNSLSTGMQCEMDPVSQTQASEKIRTLGYNVVGWYHSHPTFAPNPSIRDIETQEKFQEWFSKGGNHFIGIIISPYNRLNNSMVSQIKCLTVSQEQSSAGDFKIPYQFSYVLFPDVNGVLNEDFQKTLRCLIEKFAVYTSRVEMLLRYKSASTASCLEKLQASIRSYLPRSDSSQEFIETLKIMIQSHFTAVDEEEYKD
ncbi:histone H2A deubiquitinase MYSM1 [Lingula anatina]|uniref:Myb-like, SWIRM and MPN domain-containing protein 1 n=1 Tax=Lingula anatina TaxID=7574 RepID=A0A1S3J5I7_LINAN|nr:histone H2A deubiquitinase MYSM1 [Lingula anatina]|eukprot:XP_013405094.1 histone H2A deubiquitinase MYSM1 [Lingula anatina]